MHLMRSFCAVAILASSVSAQVTLRILFVGDHFTNGAAPPVLNFNSANVTDAKGTGYGGIPGIWRRLVEDHPDIGNHFTTTILAPTYIDLQTHANDNAAILSRANAWDIVVLQEQHSMTLPASRGGDPFYYATGLKAVMQLVKTGNPNARFYLFQTWPTPDLVYGPKTPYYNCGHPIFYNQVVDLRTSVSAAGAPYDLAPDNGIAFVGERFWQAIVDGYAVDGSGNNGTATVNLWASNQWDASKEGSYLAALTLFRAIVSVDPRDVATGPGSAAAALGIPSAVANQLAEYAIAPPQ